MLKTLEVMTFSGWVATLAGWYVTEVGRQPWLVAGILRTADAVTPVPASSVGFSLTIYLTLYAVLLYAYIHTVRVIARKAILTEEFETNEPTASGSLMNVDAKGSAKGGTS